MRAKTFFLWTIVAIVVFLVISNPSHAAVMVQGILGWLRHGAEAIISFVSNIFR